MLKQSFEEKIRSGGEKFKAIREGKLKKQIGRKATSYVVALRRESTGKVYIEETPLFMSHI